VVGHENNTIMQPEIVYSSLFVTFDGQIIEEIIGAIVSGNQMAKEAKLAAWLKPNS
jgi:hypothetical protein